MTNEQQPAAPAVPEIKLTKPYHYNRRAEFDTHVQPVLDLLHKVCTEHGLPYNLDLQYLAAEGVDGTFHSSVVTDACGQPLDASVNVIACNMLHGVFAQVSAGVDGAYQFLAAHPIVTQASMERDRIRSEIESTPQH